MSQSMSLEELRDRIEIRELTARYNSLVDKSGPPTDFIELFSEDGVLEIPRTGVKIAGRAELLRWFEGRPKEQLSLHSTTDSVIKIDGNSAIQNCRVIVYHKVGDLMVPGSIGTYSDRLIRDADGWRFSYRCGQTTASRVI